MSISAQSKAFVIESVGIDATGRNAEVATLTDGRYVVVWQEVLGTPADGFYDTDGAVFARVYGADGSVEIDTFQVNGWSPGLQDSPQVAATSDGGFAISYNSTLSWGDGPADVDTFMVSFDASGTVKPYSDGSGILAPYRDIDPDNPGSVDTGSFLVDAGNGYVALVQEASLNSGLTTVSLLGPDGSVLGFADDNRLANFDKVSSVTRLDGGNILIAGERANFVVLMLSDVSLNLAPTGIPGVAGPVTFATLFSGIDASDVKVTALSPGVFAPGGAGGGFVMSALQPVGANTTTLVVQTFSAWGTNQGSASINIAMPYSGPHPTYDVLGLKDGTFVVAWTSKGLNGQDVLVGHYDSNGAALGASVVVQGNAVAGDQFDPSLSLMADGRVIVTFTDTGNNPINGVLDTLHAVTLTITSTSSGYPPTLGADRILGTSGHDAIDGLAGNDTLFGQNGNDALFGGDGNDSLIGGNGNDGLIGGSGNDILAGSDGNDGLSGGAGSDILRGENGRDALSGGQQADKLYGGADNDRLDGGSGNDLLEGGTGADIFVFRHGGGADVVTDFAVDDFLRLDHKLWSEMGDLAAGAVLTQFAKVVGLDTVLTFVGGETITLQNFTALVASDLQLV